MKSQINIQDQFLNQLRKDGTSVTVFLLNGFQEPCIVLSAIDATPSFMLPRKSRSQDVKPHSSIYLEVFNAS